MALRNNANTRALHVLRKDFIRNAENKVLQTNRDDIFQHVLLIIFLTDFRHVLRVVMFVLLKNIGN